MLGAIIGAGASLLGGLLNKSSSDQANALNRENALRQEALQREFAQSGIQWKVADAKKAGVHPLYALGAQTTSYSPVSVGAVGDTSLGSGVASAGQDLSRAIAATSSKSTRTEAAAAALSLERAGLENELLRSQIAKTRAQIGPPMPTLVDGNPLPGQPVSFPLDNKPGERPQLAIGGVPWVTDPGTANVDDWTKRYGEMADYVAGPMVAFRDLADWSNRYFKRFHRKPSQGPHITETEWWRRRGSASPFSQSWQRR